MAKNIDLSNITQEHAAALRTCYVQGMPPPAILQACNPFGPKENDERRARLQVWSNGHVTADADTTPYALGTITGRVFYAVAAICKEWRTVPGIVMSLDKIATMAGTTQRIAYNALKRLEETHCTCTLTIGLEADKAGIYASGLLDWEIVEAKAHPAETHTATMAPMLLEVVRTSGHSVYVELPEVMINHLLERGWANAPEKYLKVGRRCYR